MWQHSSAALSPSEVCVIAALPLQSREQLTLDMGCNMGQVQRVPVPVPVPAAGAKAPGQASIVSMQARAGNMPKVSSFGSLPRSLSQQSVRKRTADMEQGIPLQPFTSQIDKVESIASTAVRAAEKINVSAQAGPVLWCIQSKGCTCHCPA